MDYKDTLVRNERKIYDIHGGKILVFGDLHFSSSFEGKHKSYIKDCYITMKLIEDHVKEEKPKAIFFLGDLCGVQERNIRDRQFLTRVLMFFATLYNITKGNVYSVKGNHEMGDFSDFDMLIGLGYIKNPKYVDYYGDDNLEVRFHFVNYGDENKKLEINTSGATNVVLGHGEYIIEGVTEWYPSKAGVELKKLHNFCGVELVFSGHIHLPSQEMLYTTLSNGETIGLFYPGSPSRVVERIDDCWYVLFEYDESQKSTGYDAKLMGLPPATEVFYDDKEFVGDEAFEYGDSEEDMEESEIERHSKALDVVIEEVLNSRIVTGDLFKQIDIIPADKAEKEIAKKYLRKAMEV